MALEAARDLSVQDLLRVLNEKLGLECTRLRETPLPPVVSAASLEPEVMASTLLDHLDECLTPVNLIDRKPRNQSTRRPEAPKLFAKPAAASQQITA